MSKHTEETDGVSQSLLFEIMEYDKDTGDFTWKKDASSRARKGGRAGWLDISTGYYSIKIDGVNYKSHRLAWLYMTGSFPDGEIDHINHITCDNRWDNLRDVSHKENAKNQKLQKNNNSSVTGVGWHKSTGKWTAYIKVDYKQSYLGLYVDWFDAVCARKSAENIHGFHANHGH